MEQERLKSIIESLLFVVDKPVSTDRFYSIFDSEFSKEHIVQTLNEIKKELHISHTRGIDLHEVSSGWQLRTKEDNNPWIKKLDNIRPVKLSQSALEVLAIVAYKQPLTRAEIDKIRGVDSSHLVKTLLDRSLIKISGRSGLPGKPLIYSTTSEFLEIFGLVDLKELPSYEEILEIFAENSIGDTDDIIEQETLSDLVQHNIDSVMLNDPGADEVLDELTEIGKELKIDIDLIQEKVDILFEEACRKYANQRKKIRSQKEFEKEYVEQNTTV